jgi:hypothetical protein
MELVKNTKGVRKEIIFFPSPINISAMCFVFCGSNAKLFNGLKSEAYCLLIQTPYTLLKFYRRFGGRYSVHRHVLIVSHANNYKEINNK